MNIMMNTVISRAFLRCFVFFLLIVCFISACWALPTENHGKLWANINKKGTVGEYNLKYIAQLHGRFGFDSPIFNSAILRLGMGYPLSQALSVWLGYDLAPNKNVRTNEFSVEQRIWQQLTWKIPAQTAAPLTSRTRLEERMSSKNSGVALRLRQKISLRFVSVLIGGLAVPVISNEIFFNLNHPDWVTNKAVDQNRFAVGVEIHRGEGAILGIGYMNQIEFRETVNRINHIFYVSCTLP